MVFVVPLFAWLRRKCSSAGENHVYVYVALYLTAETLIRFAQWEHNQQAGTEDTVIQQSVGQPTLPNPLRTEDHSAPQVDQVLCNSIFTQQRSSL